jgi:hypothetical protein
VEEDTKVDEDTEVEEDTEEVEEMEVDWPSVPPKRHITVFQFKHQFKLSI